MSKHDNIDDWLTARQIADLTGWQLNTVRRKIDRGQLAPVKMIGPVRVVHRSALEGVTVRPRN